MTTVLKIQRSLFSSTGNLQVWITSKDLSFDQKIDQTEQIDDLLGDDNSKYFVCDVIIRNNGKSTFTILYEDKKTKF